MKKINIAIVYNSLLLLIITGIVIKTIEHGELWRIIFSIVGFMIFSTFLILLVKQKIKLKRLFK